MKGMLAVLAVGVLSTGVLLAAAGRQDGEMHAPKPTKFHEYMKQLEGTWDAATEFMSMNPGEPPMKSKGTQTDKLIAGGLFVVSDTKGEMMGQEFIGHGVLGYDTLKKKYVGSWVDSMSTAIWTSEGTVDEAGKVFTAVMEGPDPTGKMMKMRMVTEITGKDSKKLTFFMPGPDGKEMQTGKIEYTRKK